MEDNLEVTKNKYSIPQMTIAFIVLTVIYSFRNIIFLNVAFFKSNNGELLLAVIGLIISLICAHFANIFAGKSFGIFIRRIKQGKVLWLTFFFTLSVIIIYYGKVSQWIETAHQPLFTMVTIFLSAIAAGLCEEFLFRDLLFNIFTKLFVKQRYVLILPAILSSLCFGLLHFINLIRQTFTVTAQQVIVVTAMGLMFCTIRILTNNMWPSVIMHIAFDISPVVLTGDALAPWSSIIVIFIWISGISLLTIWAYHYHCLKERLN